MLPPEILIFIHIDCHAFDQKDQNNKGKNIAHIFGTPIGTIWGLPGCILKGVPFQGGWGVSPFCALFWAQKYPNRPYKTGF